MYAFFFAKKIFYNLNLFLYRLGLSGMGVLNFQDSYISGEYYFLEKYLGDGLSGVVFDVGANVGNFSKSVNKINDQLDIYAFEPHPINFKKLRSINMGSRFHPIESAVGDVDGQLEIFDYNDNDGSSHASLYREVIEEIRHSESVFHTVPVKTLASFFAANNIHEVKLLKIDVEGHELPVLKGLGSYLANGAVKAIHFEFNEMNVFSRVFFKDFVELLSGYDLYRLLPNDMLPLKNYKPYQFEIFAYQNIVAIYKN